MFLMCSVATYLTSPPDVIVIVIVVPSTFSQILTIPKSQINGSPFPVRGQLMYCESDLNLKFTSGESSIRKFTNLPIVLKQHVWQASTRKARKAHFEYSTVTFFQACRAHFRRVFGTFSAQFGKKRDRQICKIADVIIPELFSIRRNPRAHRKTRYESLHLRGARHAGKGFGDLVAVDHRSFNGSIQ